VIIPAGAAQINYVFGGIAAPTGAEITIGFDGVAGVPYTPTQLAELAEDSWTTNLRPRTVDDVTLETIRVKFGPNETGPSTELAVNLAGSVSANTAAPNTSYLIHKNTALGGRRGRGRMYYPGVNEIEVDEGGTVLAAVVTAWNTALAAYLTQMEAGGGDVVVLHAAGISSVPVPTPILSLSVDNRVATQRRRLRR
jgi:hypothetical protein